MSLVDMAMALESNLVYSGIGAGILQAPECWSTANWGSESGMGSWEWEDPAMVRSECASGGCSVVSPFSKSGGTASGTSSISSGIPGVGDGDTRVLVTLSTIVKDEPDENGQAPSGQGDGFFSLGRRENEGRPRGAAGGVRDGSSVMSGGRDVTLKLGRRTHFEDSAAGAKAKGASSSPGKKHRPLSPSAAQIPRCQVEGCEADLSGCKDYYKRHKVCQMHSKAPKAIAGGIEQRFCQQCSRFHVLKEFDEGKRSCRRRLAGHNERRRKPSHPETHSLFGLGNSFLHCTDLSTPFHFSEDSKPSNLLNPAHRSSFLDSRLLHGYGSTRSSPWSVKGRNDNIPTFQLENLKAPSTTSKSSSSLHLSGHHFLEEPSLGPLGQGLSLSSSTLGGVLGNLEQSRRGSCSQALSSVSGMMNSGRALSLLSSQSWASRPSPGASTPVAVGLSQTTVDSTLEQLVASSSSCSDSSNAHHLRFHSGGSPTSAQQQLFSVQSGDSVALDCGLAATGNGTTHQRQSCSNVGNMLGGLGGYQELNPMLAITGSGQGLEAALSSDFGAGSHEAGRPTMDLMQQVLLQHSVGHAPHSSQSHGVHSGMTLSVSGGQYSNGFSSLRPLEASIFTSQQFL